MSERQRGGGGFAQSMAFSAARGGGLIALAILVGLVLLQVVDSSGGEASDAGLTVTTQAPEPTDTLTPDDTPPPDEAPVEDEAPPPSEIRVKVLNGADPDAPLAGNLSEVLRVEGYQTLPPDNTSARTGDVVFCKEAFAASAPVLAAAVGEGATVEPFPEPPPEGAENVAEYDCLVVLGG